MEPNQLFKLIKMGECSTVEFKQQFSDFPKIAKEMIAFANSKGGYLLIGVDDKGKLCGVLSQKSDAELIKQVAENYCEPPLNYKFDFADVGNKEIVIVYIPESQTKPHRIQDYNPKFDLTSAQVYVRVNDKSVLASKEMVKLLQTQTTETELKNYSIGKTEQKVFEFLEKSERISVKELAGYVNISNRRASRTLINLVRAGLLFIHTKDNGEEFFTSS